MARFGGFCGAPRGVQITIEDWIILGTRGNALVKANGLLRLCGGDNSKEVVMEWIMNHGMEILNIVAYVVLAASIIAKFTKNVYDDKVVNFLLRLLSLAPSNPAKGK
jgi:hypothetical protein